MGSRAPAVEAGTERGHQFGHVPHQVIVDSCAINDHHAAMVGVESSGDVLGSWPTRISELERGLKHDTALARSYTAWLVTHGEDAPKAKRLLAA